MSKPDGQLWARSSGGLQAAVCRAKGPKEEDFGLEAKATSESSALTHAKSI